VQEALAAAGIILLRWGEAGTAEEKLQREGAEILLRYFTDQQDKDGHQHHKEAGIPENAAYKYYCPCIAKG
jgi:hypothetical protein